MLLSGTSFLSVAKLIEVFLFGWCQGPVLQIVESRLSVGGMKHLYIIKQSPQFLKLRSDDITGRKWNCFEAGGNDQGHWNGLATKIYLHD